MPETKITELLLENLEQSLSRAQVCISTSTSQLRKAYQQDENILESETMRYRRYLYTEGVQYGSKVYPRTLDLVSKVKDTLEYYVHLDESEFSTVIDEIRTECLEHSKQAFKVQITHTYVLENLKRLDNEMRTARNQAQSKAIALKDRSKAKKESADVVGVGSLVVGAVGTLLNGPITGIITTVVGRIWQARLKFESKIVGCQAAAANQNGTTLDILINSLEGLVEAVNVISEFITVMANDLQSISRVGIEQKTKRVHFIMIKGMSGNLVDRCRGFIAIEPAITSDLRSIKEKLDIAYIEEWNEGLENVFQLSEHEAT